IPPGWTRCRRAWRASSARSACTGMRATAERPGADGVQAIWTFSPGGRGGQAARSRHRRHHLRRVSLADADRAGAAAQVRPVRLEVDLVARAGGDRVELARGPRLPHLLQLDAEPGGRAGVDVAERLARG